MESTLKGIKRVKQAVNKATTYEFQNFSFFRLLGGKKGFSRPLQNSERLGNPHDNKR